MYLYSSNQPEERQRGGPDAVEGEVQAEVERVGGEVLECDGGEEVGGEG